MKRITFAILFVSSLIGCTERDRSKNYTSVEIEIVFEDSVSIRAITFLDDRTLAFAGSRGMFGTVDLRTHTVRSNVQRYDTITPDFRAVAGTSTDFFMLSVASPALLYKTGDSGQMELVYKEEGEGVFYDSMTFWNDEEGIAIGDTVDGCLSIIITRDGGHNWKKIPCEELPPSKVGEGAFAASDTNIAVVGEKTWVATTAGRIIFSLDKGKSWEVFKTPIIKDEPTQGIYSIDFYDENLGFGIGGDYTQPEANTANKAITEDGGKTWTLVADGQEPNYKSCVQFVPNSNGDNLTAVGFTGISVSNDRGKNWISLSEESFYTVRFLNDSVAYAAGKNRIAKLVFK
ncbi:WD40/YVTN/BNR-like repeat-containing protein [Allomuricauda sp. SCSIO 65647]|uniref:WD40/YVTN/BNR-like repeat-containing protein n=1 Tax=Allomuricauda sp. SCSIO 65647 TaxID=2908843 RepID=UPI001F26215A|nr:oxidoreductase [Muricauda sp. SCSIO 65647]UJH67710.1 oxidoreductase [Muricauda sp. SCSIO 65647]